MVRVKSTGPTGRLPPHDGRGAAWSATVVVAAEWDTLKESGQGGQGGTPMFHRGVGERRWRFAVALAVFLAGVTVLALLAPRVRAAAILAPDLVADWGEYDNDPVGTERVARIEEPEEMLLGGEMRLVVKFDGYVSNIGQGPIRIEGNPQADSVYQWLLTDADTFVKGPKVRIVFENDDGHNHWHLENAMEYSLWDEAMNEQVTVGSKVGFCLYDINRIGDQGPESAFYTAAVVNWCDSGEPDSTHVVMGTSAGWSDIYGSHITLQWVDISEVAPGLYRLASGADVADQIQESDESNNGVAFHPEPVVVPGHTPVNVEARTVADTPVEVQLLATAFGDPPAPVFELVEGPAHGTVEVDSSTGRAVYRADPAFSGVDEFTYTVHDGGRYPLTRPTAGAQVTVDPPAGVAGRFSDDDGSVFEGDIEALAGAGITLGCNPPVNDRFCPDDAVTRGQMSAFLVRALGLPAGVAGRFSDDDGSVFEGDIEALAGAGITLGCNPPVNDRFCPDDAVTRGQMSAFLVRALGLPAGVAGRFSDDDGSVFEGDIEALAGAGITLGCNPPVNDRFCPDDAVTRGQMAAFLVRALDLPG